MYHFLILDDDVLISLLISFVPMFEIGNPNGELPCCVLPQKEFFEHQPAKNMSSFSWAPRLPCLALDSSNAVPRFSAPAVGTRF